jgi:chaperonin GroES
LKGAISGLYGTTQLAENADALIQLTEFLGVIMTNIKPLHDRVVVKRLEEEDRTAGGIIIPDSAKEKPQRGEIIAVGAGARGDNGNIIALEVKVGDIVLFGKWSGTEIKLNGEELLVMKESDIIAILTGEAASKKKAA